MCLSASSARLLAFSLAVLHSTASRVQSQGVLEKFHQDLDDPSEDEVGEAPTQALNASKAQFAMPTFDELARVRPRQLQEAGLTPKLGEDVCTVFCTRVWGWGKAQKGIEKSVWEDKAVGSKISSFSSAEFDATRAATWQHQKKKDGRIDFDQFLQITEFDEAWQIPAKPPTLPDSVSDVKKIAKWLATTFQYWQHFSGKTLAKQFVKAACTSFEDCPAFDRLVQFATLDTDRNAALDFTEAYLMLPDNGTPEELAWPSIAAVEESDFTSLHFPSKLAKSILGIGESGTSIKLSVWDQFDLRNVLDDFVKRDKRPSEKSSAVSLSGDLKFHQIADVLPGETDSNGNVAATIQGEQVDIHVPTFDEVAGENKKGILELTAKDIEEWLKSTEQGMENKWFFWTDKNAHAKKMARHILHWGDNQQGAHNGRLQGPAGQHDQFADVAPRLAVFIHLDRDHDGNIDFQAALPFLKAAVS